MKTKRSPFIVISIIVVLVLAGAYYAYRLTQTESSVLTASGTVEATEILIAPEISGKVSEVLVNEGDIVQAGDVLFRLDDALLQSQYKVAVTMLDAAKAAAQISDTVAATAQAQYDLILNTALADQKSFRSSDWILSKPSDYDQPVWYFDKTEQVVAAQAEVQNDNIAVNTAKDKLASVIEKTASSEFLIAEKRLTQARTAFDVANSVLDLSSKTDQSLKDSAQKTYDDVLAELNSAQIAYNDAVTTSGATDVLTARADLRVAQERFDTAQDILRSLQTGELSLKVVAAQKNLDQAHAATDQAKITIQQAEANLALISTQINKLTVHAPTEGMILTRALEPGEVVMSGSGLLNMARLNDLTITVYIPEDRYGEISIGQIAEVMVDSFPGEIFTASVINISGQAEFTPRNVQTVEGRKATVFAIKLTLADADGKLKPGMPADILFK
jgi:HlyD family secretion protein